MDHTVSMELSAVQLMTMLVDHPPAAEVASALPAKTISEPMVEHLGLNRFLDTDVIIGDAVAYVGADYTGVPTGWNTVD